jgi:hypothetical protein
MVRLGYNLAASFNALSRFRRLGGLILDWRRDLGIQGHVGGMRQEAVMGAKGSTLYAGTFAFFAHFDSRIILLVPIGLKLMF